MDQERSPDYNAEPGIAIVPGSNLAREMAKHEQFPSKWTAAAMTGPGNPYTYRAVPKMVYRAERYNGQPACMAAPPDPYEFKDGREFERAEAASRKFTERCQLVVNDEREYQRAMESGYRESPKDAVDHLIARELGRNNETAHRLHDDRNLSEPAKREAAAIEATADEPLPEIPEQRRGRKRKAAA